jgi:hypothetical protein
MYVFARGGGIQDNIQVSATELQWMVMSFTEMERAKFGEV